MTSERENPVGEGEPGTPPVMPPEFVEVGGQESSAVEVIIPYRNKAALVGYYFGVFSLVPVLGGLFALPGLILGVIGLVKGIRHSERRGKVHAIVAIVLSLLGCYNYLAMFMMVFFYIPGGMGNM